MATRTGSGAAGGTVGVVESTGPRNPTFGPLQRESSVVAVVAPLVHGATRAWIAKAVCLQLGRERKVFPVTGGAIGVPSGVDGR